MKETGFIVNFLVLTFTIVIIFLVIFGFLYLEVSRSPRVDYEDNIFTFTIAFTSYFLINTIINTIYASLSNLDKYFISLIIVISIMIPYYVNLQKKIISRKIAVRYGQKQQLEITEDTTKSDELLISIDNEWKKDIICDIIVSCPKDIKISFKNDKEDNIIKEDKINVKANETYWEYVFFRYDGNPGEAEAKINVICRDKNRNIVLEKDDKIKLLKIR